VNAEIAIRGPEHTQFVAWVKTKLAIDADPSFLNRYVANDDGNVIIYSDDELQRLWEAWQSACKWATDNICSADAIKTVAPNAKKMKAHSQ
jgi:hypothetical protein